MSACYHLPHITCINCQGQRGTPYEHETTAGMEFPRKKQPGECTHGVVGPCPWCIEERRVEDFTELRALRIERDRLKGELSVSGIYDLSMKLREVETERDTARRELEDERFRRSEHDKLLGAAVNDLTATRTQLAEVTAQAGEMRGTLQSIYDVTSLGIVPNAHLTATHIKAALSASAGASLLADLERMRVRCDGLEDALLSLGHDFRAKDHIAWCAPCRSTVRLD